MSEWTSVKDNMPPDQTTVLLACDGCVLMGVYREKAGTPFQATYSGNQEPFGHDITHWMPLPEPPK